MPEQSGIAGADDIADHLPLGLALAQLIPPAPNRRKSAIDVLYDFGGSTWIAYGASSLLVISHFPSPHSPHESQLGPLFHQAIDPPPCDDPAAVVNCVSWCPSQPSDGVVAAALGNRVWLYSPEPGNDPGSFSWRSYAGMVQAFPVEGIGWTGSGDGLIVAGTEVVLWTRKSVSWEVAWKSSVDVPQALVSATWYAEGPIATSADLLSPSSDISKKEFSPLCTEACNSVVVYHNDVKSGIMKVQLFHPQPVTMIHWRPSTATQFQKDVSHSWRDVLLTCCLDGTVRLWSEIDTGRVRKYNKEAHDQKATRQSFHVIAVIEINQCLKGTLGRDIFIEWAIEFSSVICKGKGDSYSLSSLGSEQGRTAKCEWLVSVGPGLSTAFWAIHCLDDTSPLRFPRLTLWKKQDLKDCEGCNSFCSETSYSTNLPVLVKVVASRSCPSGPPVVCSLFQLLSDNRLSWSQIYSPTVNGKEEISLSPSDSEKILSCFTGITLNQYGHAGKIIQLAIHPHSYEVELAVSLDNNGLLLFWSISTLSSGTLGIPLLIHPLWELLGKFSSSALSADVKYLSLRWAPSVLVDKRFLLLGHADGIDCFLIKISQKGEDIVCHKMFTIPFGDHDQGYGPPEFIYTSPFASTCEQSFASNSFLVFALWMTNFRALSWKVVLHSEDPLGSNCRCISDAETVSLSGIGRYTSCFANKIYYAIVNPCASKFPDMQSCNQVISAAVVPPDNSILCGQQYTTSYDSSCGNLFGYQMATGCSDGTLKLWKVSHSKNSEQIFLPWELVGIFTAHEGPVSAVSLSSCSSKIATVSIDGQNCKSTLHIWECIFLIGGGSFLLEDVISLNGPVVALNWLSVGNGQSLLGVCLPNELHVYSAKSPNTVLGKFEKPRQMHAWNCIARSHTYPASQDFLWGPKMIPVLVHEKHFSLFSRWLFKAKQHSVDHSLKDVGKVDSCAEHTMYLEKGVCNTKEPREGGMDKTPYVCTHCFEMSRLQYNSKTLLYSIVDVADKLHGSLQVYHPMALLQNLYSGNWIRAFIVVKHLTGHMKSIESAVTIQESTKSGKSFHHIREINLSRYFENTTPNLNNDKLQWGENITETSNLQFPNHTFSFMNGETQNNTTTTTFQKTETMEFKNILEKCRGISGIKDTERIQILAIIDLLGEICDSSYASAYGSLDEPGRRFWVSVRFQNLLFQRNHGRLAAGEELVANSGLVAWAVQSDCQDNLFSILSAEPSWLEMRNLGVGYWLTNTSQLRMRMEKLARSQYLKNKDPKDCALLYLALNRLHVLAGLFKISKNEKDKPLVGFLSRNFQEEKNKAAALKNAYVLMGKHQLELAIAFFLLGGELSSAVSVCAKNLGDGQLALVICRLIEGNGGPVERHLISNILLPSAIEKGDYWLSSLFEWTLGNYSNSFKNLFDSHIESVTSKSAATCNRATFLDPEVGQYCVLLAAKNCLKNALGDKVAAVLSKFSTVISARALNRCGLPLDALECFSLSKFEAKDQDNLLDVGDHKIFHGILNPFSNGAPNWLSGVVACYLESNSKSNIAMQYISRFLRDHPSWPCKFPLPYGEYVINGEFDTHQDELQMGDCKQDLDVVMSIFGEKYSLKMLDLANMILLFSCNEGLFFHGYWLLRDVFSKEHDINDHSVNFSILNSDFTRLTLKLSKEILHSFARYVVSVNFNETVLQLVHDGSVTAEKDSHHKLFPTGFCLRTLLYLLKSLRPLLNLYNNVILTEGLTLRPSSVLDLLDYCLYFAFAFCQRNIKVLITMIQPIIKSFSSEKTSFEVVAGELKKLLQKILEMLRFENSRGSSLGTFAGSGCRQEQEIESLAFPVSEDEMWHVVDACLWIHLSSFSKHQLNEFSVTERCEVDRNLINPSNRFSFIIASLLTTALAYISSSFTKQLASFLRRKASKGLPVTALLWINGSNQPDSGYLNKNLNHDFGTLQLRSNQDTESMLRILWDISVSSKEICVSFVNERVASFPYSRQNSSCSWNDMQRSISIGYENGVSPNNKTEGNVSSTNNESGPLHNRKVQDRDGYIEFKRNPSLQSEPTPFQTPIEVLKRSGELLEALCFNSVNEQQAVVVSNRKGLVFLNWKSEQPLRSNAEYIWSDSDWPQDGWAGCESTPIPTFVSPGIGLGSKKGLHLGLGGATIGIGSLARPGRDLTGGGAFGIPGYAGIGASGLGWGEQEGFEEFIDPLPTAESIRSRALSSHPSRPFFLVGSSNTHVYLWEFDKDRATSTYGVLPAANVPPPYALASISSVQVDHCGQRFATAALDGTVCTWQLEVGGRNNVRPTESALCFNNHATDVAYVASSGSILAAAGYSTNGVNVIVWDTLAPPATSQASLVCHEGGARSISVFDNDIGSGSISPLIVTGGKGGDVGLHDFRFITTGRTKRHRHSSEQDFKSMHETSKYGENTDGMIWYIPKAHLGSVTKIATIPNTSLFLTGSKDGEVKLWDARRSELVFHWQKMHDRHTFLQPNSRGFGGVVRAAVTDIQVFSGGFLTCGADGSVKLVKLKV